ncbi:hypothetical protein ACIG8S_04060 [[Kitasatospora] papulosa]|jgi:hypothetical protein|uniref:hypothetical protein n=1 Tax=[Kitasatospora] papulosa TaxID=1464011 RepID=UPI0037D425DF
MTVIEQPTLDGTVPAAAISKARRRVDDYDTWVAEVRPTFEEIAATGSPFLCWKVAKDNDLPDPPDRDHDWGRFAATLHREGLIRTDGFGLTRDKSAVRRWRGTAAARRAAA